VIFIGYNSWLRRGRAAGKTPRYDEFRFAGWQTRAAKLIDVAGQTSTISQEETE
jgi:hypothetical protein